MKTAALLIEWQPMALQLKDRKRQTPLDVAEGKEALPESLHGSNSLLCCSRYGEADCASAPCLAGEAVQAFRARLNSGMSS